MARLLAKLHDKFSQIAAQVRGRTVISTQASGRKKIYPRT
jgi:hypothetical protein